MSKQFIDLNNWTPPSGGGGGSQDLESVLTNGNEATIPINLEDGTYSNPSYSFTNSLGSGMYFDTTDLAFSNGGVRVLYFNGTDLHAEGNVVGAGFDCSTNTTPPDNGIYVNSTGDLVVRHNSGDSILFTSDGIRGDVASIVLPAFEIVTTQAANAVYVYNGKLFLDNYTTSFVFHGEVESIQGAVAGNINGTFESVLTGHENDQAGSLYTSYFGRGWDNATGAAWGYFSAIAPINGLYNGYALGVDHPLVFRTMKLMSPGDGPNIVFEPGAENTSGIYGQIGLAGGTYIANDVANAATYNVPSNVVLVRSTYSTTDPQTITIPTNLLVAGKILIIKDEAGGAGGNTITITTENESIDGGANAQITTNYGTVKLYCNGTAWFTM